LNGKPFRPQNLQGCDFSERKISCEVAVHAADFDFYGCSDPVFSPAGVGFPIRTKTWIKRIISASRLKNTHSCYKL